jgi:hypothetical protein
MQENCVKNVYQQILNDDILKSAKSLGQLSSMNGGTSDQKISTFYLDRINDILRDSLLHEKEIFI